TTLVGGVVRWAAQQIRRRSRVAGVRQRLRARQAGQEAVLEAGRVAGGGRRRGRPAGGGGGRGGARPGSPAGGGRPPRPGGGAGGWGGAGGQGRASRPGGGLGGGQSGWGAPQQAEPAGWGAPQQAEPAGWGAPQQAEPAGWGAPQQAEPAGWGAGAPAAQDGWGMGQPQGSGGGAAWDAAPAAAGRDWGMAAAPGQMAQSGQQGGAMAGAPAGYDAGGYAGGGFGDADRTQFGRPSVAGAQRLGVLVVRQGKEQGRVYEARKDRLTIGRSRDSDIFLEDLAVSRLHTTVYRDDSGRYIIHHEKSANGTYVNSQGITEQPLEEGDEIQVGQTILAFMMR